jgi:group II intron reverse transcriptase/maturase
VVRRQCWAYDYCIDLDIKSFFDEVSHDLLLKALRKHVSENWVLRLIEQWLRAPIVEADGQWRMRVGRGTPQGGVISPLLSNLFLHYVLDAWLERTFSGLALIRYADDAIVCCRSAAQAELVLARIGERMRECGLRLHPVKTKIVFCKKGGRVQESDYPVCFDFLGYRFQPRTKRSSKSGKLFLGFDGAISPAAAKRITQVVRDSNLTRQTQGSLHQIAKALNPKLRGWYNYYSELGWGELKRVLERVNFRIMRWGMRKYRRLRGSYRRACAWMKSLAARAPDLFYHWQFGITFISKQTA